MLLNMSFSNDQIIKDEKILTSPKHFLYTVSTFIQFLHFLCFGQQMISTENITKTLKQWNKESLYHLNPKCMYPTLLKQTKPHAANGKRAVISTLKDCYHLH